MSKERARELRKNMPAPEAKPWNSLRELRPLGHHFRRQVEIGGRYYVDFCCRRAGLVIEVDGDTHFCPGAQDRDEIRGRFLTNEGYRVIRVTNSDVMHNLDGVITVVLNALDLSSRSPPSP